MMIPNPFLIAFVSNIKNTIVITKKTKSFVCGKNEFQNVKTHKCHVLWSCGAIHYTDNIHWLIKFEFQNFTHAK